MSETTGERGIPDGRPDPVDDRALTHSPPAIAAMARILGRPRTLALGCVVVLALAGWAVLGLMVADHLRAGPVAALGPGMGLLDLLARPDAADHLGKALWDALCAPGFGHVAASWSAADVALVVAMWIAMTLAMMLPTAGPMLVTYAEIADTAARKGEPVVSPLVIAAGYLVIWLAVALAAAFGQWGLTRAALLDASMASASPLFSGAIFIGAGVYQFSALKHACVTQCQRPFPFFFANWTTSTAGVFRLGLRQGLYCLGCCWAMMMVMFAVGTMNVVWMAILGLVMTLEKIATTTRFSKATGIVFILIGVGFVGAAVIARLPFAS